MTVNLSDNLFSLSDVMVESAGYTSFTRKQIAEKFNVFQVEFKTFQPTGLLLHAKGAKDFVTLELIKGKLRYEVYANLYSLFFMLLLELIGNL